MKTLQAVLCFVLSIGEAAAMGITILEAQYSTDLFMQWTLSTGTVINDPPPTVSSSPITSDLVRYPSDFYARATANTFSVATETSTGPLAGPENPTLAKAEAESTVTFKTLTDGLAPLSLLFDVTGDGVTAFSDGFISLHDMTTNQSLFSFTLDDVAHDFFDGINRLIFIDFNAQLSASHTYRLGLGVSSSASEDAQFPAIHLSGLTAVPPVPEPETWAMMLVGLGVLASSRIRRPRDPKRHPPLGCSRGDLRCTAN